MSEINFDFLTEVHNDITDRTSEGGQEAVRQILEEAGFKAKQTEIFVDQIAMRVALGYAEGGEEVLTALQEAQEGAKTEYAINPTDEMRDLHEVAYTACILGMCVAGKAKA